MSYCSCLFTSIDQFMHVISFIERTNRAAFSTSEKVCLTTAFKFIFDRDILRQIADNCRLLLVISMRWIFLLEMKKI